MPRKMMSYKDIMAMAARYGVDKNALFVSAARRYDDQVKLIEKLRKQLEDDGLMVEHVNVKGDSNSDIHPLVAQLPKHSDTANKTLSVMLDIVTKLGKKDDESAVSFDVD